MKMCLRAELSIKEAIWLYSYSRGLKGFSQTEQGQKSAEETLLLRSSARLVGMLPSEATASSCCSCFVSPIQCSPASPSNERYAAVAKAMRLLCFRLAILCSCRVWVRARVSAGDTWPATGKAYSEVRSSYTVISTKPAELSTSSRLLYLYLPLKRIWAAPVRYHCSFAI